MGEACGHERTALTRRRLVRATALGAPALAIGLAGGRLARPFAAGADGTPVATPASPHWTYAGEEGPDHWGALSPAYTTCAIGTSQSPIDIIHATHVDLSDIAFAYQPIDPMRIVNNGHTIQVNVSADPDTIAPDEARNGITVAGVDYGLAQFHFHTPSEHQIDGTATDMELHLVHKTPEGNAAVIGILLKVGATDNAALAPVFAHMATARGPEQSIATSLSPAAFFPPDHATYRYTGSLTTPPCTEGIAWFVFVQPVEIGPDQVAAFHACYAENARPVQELNGREIDEDD